MSALGWLALTLMAAALAPSLAFNWWQSRQLDQVHGTHASSRPRGDAAPARPGTSLVRPVNGRPLGTQPRLSEQRIVVVETDDAPPWDIPTSSFPALSQAEQNMRAEYIASGMQDAKAAGELTPERLRVLMDESAGRTPALEYGQTCTANVLAAEQEGREVA